MNKYPNSERYRSQTIWKFVSENMDAQAKLIHERNRELIKQNKLQLFKVGDQVYVYIHESSNKKVEYKIKPHWRGPYAISRVISIATYEINDGKTTFISWSGHLRPARDLHDDSGNELTPF